MERLALLLGHLRSYSTVHSIHHTSVAATSSSSTSLAHEPAEIYDDFAEDVA